MATGQLSGVIRHLRRAAFLPDGGRMTDGQLLRCFITDRDEAAFVALVRRHGPMVLGVCRRVLDHHDAEDAFQVTFLVLARKATSIGQPELLGNWLYGAAYRAALEAKAARRRVKERQVSVMPEPEAVAEADVWLDLRPILDQELSRLPDKYRVPVVLCDLEGRTRRDVARQLNIPAGTLSGRLTTARRLLAKRLAGHGLAVAGGALAATLSQNAASACVPSPLVGSTVKAAILLAAGHAAPAGLVSAKVAALTEGVLKTMFLTKLKIATAVLLVGVLACGAAMLALPALATGQTEARTAGKTEPAPDEAQPPAKKADEAGTWKKRSVLLGPVGPATFAAGGKVVVMGSCEAKLWDTLTAKEITTLDIQAERCAYCMEALPGGKTLVTVHRGGLVRLWDATTGEERSRFQAHEDVAQRLAVSPNGKILATAGEDKTVKLWDAATGKELHSLEGHTGNVYAMAFTPDGKTLATAGLENGVLLWDVGAGKKQVTLPLPRDEGRVACLAFSPDGTTLASASRSGHLRLWSTATWKVRAALKREATIGDLRGMAFAPDGKTIACAGTEKGPAGKQVGFVLLWDVLTGKERTKLEADVPFPLAVAFSPDGKLLAVAGFANIPNGGEGALQLWELRR